MFVNFGGGDIFLLHDEARVHDDHVVLVPD